MKLPETIAYWAKMQDPDTAAEQAAVALAREVQRLQREASRHGNPNGESAPCKTINERRNYTLTDEQYDALFQACRPVPYVVVGGTVPSSPQQNANRAWQQLGQEMGFDWETVERGRTPQQFSAVPTQ